MDVHKLTDEQCRIALSYLIGALDLFEDNERINNALKRAEEYAINQTEGK